MSLSLTVKGQYRNNKTELVGLHHPDHRPWDTDDALEIQGKMDMYIFCKLSKFKSIQIGGYITGKPEATITLTEPLSGNQIQKAVNAMMFNMNSKLK